MTFQSRAIQLAEPICAITTVSSGHSHSTLNETSFENQEVSTTNVVAGCMKGCSEAGRGLSLSFHFSLSVRDLWWQRMAVDHAEPGTPLCGTEEKKTGLSG